LTDDFLVYTTSTGLVHHYSINDWGMLNEIKHSQSIQKLALNGRGVKFVFTDVKGDAFLCNPFDSTITKIPFVPPGIQGVLWEAKSSSQISRDKFILWNSNVIHTYLVRANTIKGPQCIKLGNTKLSQGLFPINLVDNAISCLVMTRQSKLVECQWQSQSGLSCFGCKHY
jgi:hypothetical protein